MKRVINAFDKMIHGDTSKSREKFASVFEEYYQCNKRNFTKLADTLSKGILNQV